MASYAVAEQKTRAAISELHEYLWGGARPKEEELLAQLLRGARALDRHIGTRGAVQRSVRPMTRHFRKGTHGADLFTFLQAVSQLSFAADRVRRKPRDAARASSELAVSLCVHLASTANRANLMESFETGQTDFAEFTSKLADALEQRGVLRAGEFRRATNQAFDLNALWDRRASTDAKRIMATASVSSAGLACVLFVDALRSLGRYRETPYARLVPVVARILRGLGSHP